MKTRACLLSGTVMIAALGGAQVAYSAEAAKTYKVNVSEVGRAGAELPSFIRVKVNDYGSGRRLESFSIDRSPDELTDVTVIVSGENGRFFLGEGCEPFSKLDYRNLRLHLSIEDGVELVGDCSRLFYDSPSIYSIKFGNVDTSRMTSMREMFALCQNVSELDLRSFNTKSLDKEEMVFLFNSCPNLVRLNIASFTQEQKDIDSVLRMFCGANLLENLSFEKKLTYIRFIRRKTEIVTDDVVCENKFLQFEKHSGGLSSSQPGAIELKKGEDLELDNKITLEQKGNLPITLTNAKLNEVSQKENNQVEADVEREKPFNRLETPISSSTFKKDSEISITKPQIVITKDDKEKVNTATVEVQQIKQHKPWYTPIIKFCSWVKRTVLSWFKR